jgi:hypothetical protein
MQTYLDEILSEINNEQAKPGSLVKKFILLNTILCGPILRRTEPKRICIWLAMSIRPERIEIKVEPLEPAGKDVMPMMWLPADRDIPVKTIYNSRQVGKNLFIILLQAIRSGSNLFETETMYGYDLIFTFKQGTTLVINGASTALKTDKPVSFGNYFNKDNSYSYANIPFPVFVVPSQNKANSRILYGSCRKTHGPGADALSAADNTLEKAWTEYYTTKIAIPSFSLFHLGDQLYADDLNEDIFIHMRRLSYALTGYEERIPVAGSFPPTDINYLVTFLDKYLKKDSRYNIEDLYFLHYINYDKNDRRKNIVIFLRKYFASNYELRFQYPKQQYEAYLQAFLDNKIQVQDLILKLFSLSGTSKSKIDLDEIVPPPYLHSTIKIPPIPVSGISYKARLSFVRSKCGYSTSTDGHALSFGEYAALYLINWGNPAVYDGKSSPNDQYELIINKNKSIKRLLANVPSYMIFDDHDITDDWNCDAFWRGRVEKSISGKRVTANGLAAYLYFQAWGNDPDLFSDNKLFTIVGNHLSDLVASDGKANQQTVTQFENSLWSFSGWAFVAPTYPRAVFMDSRTQRYQLRSDLDYFPEYNQNKRVTGARLLSPAAFSQLAGLLKASGFKAGEPVIFCAATPIISAPLAHRLQVEMVDGEFNNKYTAVIQSKFQKPGRYEQDWELWHANPRGKYEFFNFIDSYLPGSQLFILSGDVHYGFHASVMLESQLSGKKYVIEQLTSSAFKNNTLIEQGKVNWLARLSPLDTKEFHGIKEAYPKPGSTTTHFKITGTLKRYSQIMDQDAWLIPYNNAGLLEFKKGIIANGIKKVLFQHYFLYNRTYAGPVTKSSTDQEVNIPVKREMAFE